MRPSLVLGALSLVLTLMPVIADGCVPSTSQPEVTAGEFYVDNDVCQPDCLFSVWIYNEANGIDGLQRQDPVVDDTCGGQIDGDVTICQILPVALLTPRRRDGRDVRGPAAVAAAIAVMGVVALAPTAEAC